MPARNSKQFRWRCILTVVALLTPALAASALPGGGSVKAQTGASRSAPGPDLSLPPVRWAEAAAGVQEGIVNDNGTVLLRYRMRKRDAKGDVLREVIESKEGSVARLIQRDGQALTAEENAAERERLEGILSSPDAFLRRVRRDGGSKSYATELLHSMPKAMLWSYVPGQPQLSGASGPAVVLDFKPDPNFKPPSLVTDGLKGVAGRVWIDAASHGVTRIEGQILHSVDFGWGGVLARVKEGGHIDMDQRQVANQRWLYSHISEHLSIREVLVHTVEENAELNTFDVQTLPAPVSYQQAIRMLLDVPVPTR